MLRKLHLESFPAIHLKKMDWMDFLLKFSSELMVLTVCLVAAGLNIFYFAGANGKSFQDQSLASSFINRHTGLNEKLFAKNSSIVTVVSDGSFLPQAQADYFTGLDSQNIASQDTAGDDSLVIGNESTILAPNPDSVQSLIQKQIKIYQTQAGDTIQSVAGQFGISQQTIMWANNLSSPSLKPGWQLIILPTNGVLVKAASNDTLPDIAHKYNPEKYNTNATVRENSADQLLQNIISYNALDSAEDINPGDLIIVPGGQIVSQPAPPAPKPSPKPKVKGKTTPAAPDTSLNDITSLGDGYDGVNHLFPKGYCTYYVANKMKITFGGNAKNWLANARASGYVVSNEPAPRTAVVTTDSKRYGHVAYVEEVTDSAILVSEMNFEHFNKVDERWIPINSPTIRGYIYP